jgi:hypothetical protein
MSEEKLKEYVITGEQLDLIEPMYWVQLNVIRSRPLSEEIRKARGDVLDEVEAATDGIFGYADYTGKMYSVYVEEWEQMIKELREGAP